MPEKNDILVVLENSELFPAIESALNALGENLIYAGNGHDAKTLALRHKFAVIIIDVNMSTIDGLVTAELIRREEKARDVPMLFLIDHETSAQQIFRGDAERLVDYVMKPVVSEVLQSKVKVFIEVDRMRRERKELLQSVEFANYAKDEFLSTLSHEIRTPLNAILGWVQILRNKGLDELTAARAMEAIERNAKTEARIIQDMLDASSATTGELHLDFDVVDFEPSIKAAVDTVRAAAEAKRIFLECEIDATGSRIVGDARRLQQIVWNLLSNSVKFTPAGGWIRVRLEEEPAYLRLTVSDNGVGIEPDHLLSIFRRFREAGSLTRKYGGLGLGLSTTRHLVELHGGVIEAKSLGIGKGATFTVCLPIREAALLTANAS